MKKIQLNRNFIKNVLVNENIRKYFINRYEDIINNSNSYYSAEIEMLCNNIEIRKIIFENFELFFKKIINKSNFVDYMADDEVEDKIDIIFKESKKSEDIVGVFRVLNRKKIYGEQKMIDLLSIKKDSIYEEKGVLGIYNIMKYIPNFINYTNENKSIKDIDDFLSSKIDDISNTEFGYYRFDFKYFKNMEKFKSSIKKKGVDFFVSFPLDNCIKLNECKQISKDIFGEFTAEHFSKMMYGQNNSDKAKIISIIIDELLEQSNKNLKESSEKFSIEDVKKIGSGVYSTVYKVGNYVVKFGKRREKLKIPNHKRILQPIIRTMISGKEEDEKNFYKKDNGLADFIEVQNLVDRNWYDNMDEQQIEEELFKIYSELRNDGIIWTDIRKENIGKLLEKNTSNIIYENFEIIDGQMIRKTNEELIPHSDGIEMFGKINGTPLDKGEYVIIDTDYIYTQDEYNEMLRKTGRARAGCRNITLEKFEKRYNELFKDFESQ